MFVTMAKQFKFWDYDTFFDDYENRPFIAWLKRGYDKLFGAPGEAGAVDSWLKGQTGSGLTNAQIQQNEFNAQQAAEQRAWAEKMDATNYQRKVADMQAAGVNPALAMGGVTAAPSGASASSGTVNPTASMSELMQLFLLKDQRRVLQAEAANINADTGKKQSETELVGKQISVFDKLTDAQLKDIESQINQRDVQNQLSKQGISESMARQALAAQQAINAHLDSEYIAKLNDAQIAYQSALTSYTNQKSAESKQAVLESAAHIDGIYQQAILQSAMAGYYSQQEQNLLEECGILQYQREQHKFTVDHQNADRNWRIASTVVSGVSSLVGAAGAGAVGASAIGRLSAAGRSITTVSPWSFHNSGGFDFIGY